MRKPSFRPGFFTAAGSLFAIKQTHDYIEEMGLVNGTAHLVEKSAALIVHLVVFGTFGLAIDYTVFRLFSSVNNTNDKSIATPKNV